MAITPPELGYLALFIGTLLEGETIVFRSMAFASPRLDLSIVLLLMAAALLAGIAWNVIRARRR